MGSAALKNQVVAVRPAARLTSADILVGLANLPHRVLEQLFVEEEGHPDALWFACSNGRNFTMRFFPDLVECYGVFEREQQLSPEEEASCTGLNRYELNELCRQLAERHAEDRAEYLDAGGDES